MAFARNIQGSNGIEGCVATLDDAAAVPMREEPLDASCETQLPLEGYRSAMAHFTLVMIHPFRDGNGRNTREYYDVLAEVGGTHGSQNVTPNRG